MSGERHGEGDSSNADYAIRTHLRIVMRVRYPQFGRPSAAHMPNQDAAHTFALQERTGSGRLSQMRGNLEWITDSLGVPKSSVTSRSDHVQEES